MSETARREHVASRGARCDIVFSVGKPGSDYYFRKLLERWWRHEMGPPLSREEKQALIDWDKTTSDHRAQLKHEITEEATSEPAA